MKSMKTSHTRENMINQEFQYHEELCHETSERNYELIGDQHHQAEKHCRKQVFNWKILIHRLIELETESQLIKVMNLKMHTIQFALIANLIGMKWMKAIDT
jgi:hypothetical protein